MKKRIAPLSGKEWLRYKPYQRVTRYDQFYIKLAQEIIPYFAPIHQYAQSFAWNREQDYDLAVVLASYFEDVVNEIGIWEETVRLGLEKTGQTFPLFDATGYELGGLNWQDVALLAWSYLSNYSPKLIAPDLPYLEPMSKGICDIFQAELESAPLTDFYEEYLVIEDESSLEELRTKLSWLCLESWLFAPDLFTRFTEELLPTNEEETYDEDTSKRQYFQLLAIYTFHIPSVWWGMMPREVLARLLDATDEYLEVLSDPRAFDCIQWAFLLREEHEHYYSFVDTHNDRPFRLIKPKHEPADDYPDPSPGEVGVFQGIKWQGDWHMIGQLSFTPERTILERLDQNDRPFCLYTAEERKFIDDTVEGMQEVFVAMFGQHYAVFSSQQEARSILTDYLAKLPNAGEEREGAPALSAPPISSSQIDDKGRVGVAFIPGEGISFWPHLPSILEDLSKIEELAPAAIGALFSKLYTGGIPPVVFEELAQEGALSEVPFPIQASSVQPFLHHQFLRRFFNPMDFAVTSPNINTV